MVQLSHLYMTTGKTIALTRQIFIGKSMSLLFNMLFVIVFLPRGKCLLISQLQSYSTVVLEPKKIKFVTVSIVSPSIHWRDGTRCHDLIFLNVDLSFKPALSIFSFTFIHEPLQFLFTFSHKGGVICVYEAVDISPSNYDSSLCLIQPSILHDVLCI